MSYIGYYEDCCNGDSTSLASNKYNIIEKNLDFIAEKFKLYSIITLNNIVRVTLPTDAQNGDWIGFMDKSGTFSTNNLIIEYSTASIRNNNDDLVVDISDVNFKLVFNNNNWFIFDMSFTIGDSFGDGGNGGGDSSYNLYDVSGTINASVNSYYLVNTSSTNAIINLPVAPSNGDWIIISDKLGTFATHKVILKYANGKTIVNNADDVEIDFNNAKLKLVYFDNNWDILNHS